MMNGTDAGSVSLQVQQRLAILATQREAMKEQLQQLVNEIEDKLGVVARLKVKYEAIHSEFVSMERQLPAGEVAYAELSTNFMFVEDWSSYMSPGDVYLNLLNRVLLRLSTRAEIDS